MARDPKAPSRDTYVSDTLQNLVRQFSQELCFYRELIQNAIDAGSGRVDVEVEHHPDKGVAVARVIDYGEGMDRRVIDTQLTRLFSSSKENDFTKIGKFGIGFVSVFAVTPDAVVVDTGKAGEHWRVLFKPDGTFERIALDEPVEGTRVEVYVRTIARDFPDFLRRSRETVRYWCRHAEAEIYFEGELVNEAFDLDDAMKVRREDKGTVVVAAASPEEEPFFGFYNQGITLLEGKKAYFEGVAFKIKSRYLEHTLSRDNVKKDPQYEKAMAIVEKVVCEDLAPVVFTALENATDAEGLEHVFEHGRRLLRHQWAERGRRVAFIPRHDGPPVSLDDLGDIARRTARVLKSLGGSEVLTQGSKRSTNALFAVEKGTVLVADAEPTPVAQALAQEGVAVLRITATGGVATELETSQGFHVVSARRFAALLTVPVDGLPPALPRLATDALALLAATGVDIVSCTFSRFGYPRSPIADLPFVLQTKPRALALPHRRAALDEDAPPPKWSERALRTLTGAGRNHLVLNVDHPLVLRLERLHAVDARTAGYLLAKLVCLADGLHPEMNVRLLQRALEATNGKA